jgi:hypothetical protein
MNIANPHPNIQIRTSISINLSASQWHLHVDKYPRVIVEKVADYLNKRVNVNFNKGEPRATVEFAFDALAKDFAMYGATSKETRKVFTDILQTVCPEGQK